MPLCPRYASLSHSLKCYNKDTKYCILSAYQFVLVSYEEVDVYFSMVHFSSACIADPIRKISASFITTFKTVPCRMWSVAAVSKSWVDIHNWVIVSCCPKQKRFPIYDNISVARKIITCNMWSKWTTLQSSHSTYIAKQCVHGMYSWGLRRLLRFATVSTLLFPLSP